MYYTCYVLSSTDYGMIVIITIIAFTISFYNKNVVSMNDTSDVNMELNKFETKMIQETKEAGNYIEEITENSIKFTNGNNYTFTDEKIYQGTIQVSKYVKEFIAQMEIDGNKQILKIYILLGKGKVEIVKNLSYTIEKNSNQGTGVLSQVGKIEKPKEEPNGSCGFPPIGDDSSISNSSTFNGIFLGNSKEIKNVYINKGVRAGFWKANDGIIKDLTISGTIIGTFSIGGIAGSNIGTIDQCYNIGNVILHDGILGDIVSGIAALNTGKVENCHNSGDIILKNGLEDCGSGIVGEGTVSNCYNNGNIYTSVVKEELGELPEGFSEDWIGTMNFGGGITIASTQINNCYNDAQLNEITETERQNLIDLQKQIQEWVGGDRLLWMWIAIPDEYIGRTGGIISWIRANATINNCGYLNTSAGSGIGYIADGTTVNGTVQSLTAENMPDKLSVLNNGLSEPAWEYDRNGEPILKVFNK